MRYDDGNTFEQAGEKTRSFRSILGENRETKRERERETYVRPSENEKRGSNRRRLSFVNTLANFPNGLR